MDYQEFSTLFRAFDIEYRHDIHQQELIQYIAVWTKSRHPALFKELESNFRKIEHNVYAAAQNFEPDPAFNYF